MKQFNILNINNKIFKEEKMTQYKSIAEHYTDKSRMQHPERKHMIYPTWLEVCGDVQDLRILNLGCGGGDSSRLLALKGAKVVGIDKEEAMLEITIRKEKENPLNIEYLLASANNLPLFEKKIDLITPAFLLHYARSKKELREIIKNIAANLKPNGRLVGINHHIKNYILQPKLPNSQLIIEWAEGSKVVVTIYKTKKESFCFNNFFLEAYYL